MLSFSPQLEASTCTNRLLLVAMDLSVSEPCHEHQIRCGVHHLEHASGGARAPEVPLFATA